MNTSGKTSSRSFRALLLSQSLGALNDNIFKLLVQLVVVNELLRGEASHGTLVLINICFVSPYIFVSSLAGWCADRFSKRTVLFISKLAELAILTVGGIGLIQHNVPLLLIVLFLLGAQAAFYSPSKYGVIPELLAPEWISRGNGLIEMFTFLAIIGGTTMGGIVSSLSVSPWFPLIVMMVISLAGIISTLSIPRLIGQGTSRSPEWNPLNILPTISKIRQDRSLFLTLCAIGFFWGVGGLQQLNLLLYAKQILLLGDLGSSLFLMALGLGIGAGSALAGLVSAGKVELGLVPLGAFGMAFGALVLSISGHSLYLSTFSLLVMGLSGGFFIVPLNSFFQQQSPEEQRGSYIAASNFVAFSGVIVSSIVLYICSDLLALSPASLCAVVGFAALLVGVVGCREMPLMFVRCINWILVHTLYSLRVHGADNIPQTGGALIICNHVAFVDPPLVVAATSRPVRFLVYRPIYDSRLVNPVAKLMGAIPIAAEDNRRELVKSLNEAREALKNGEVVCVFAEGSLSRIGHLLKFERGFELIMKGVDAPIIPAYIDQIWGSIFSFKGGKFFWKVPRELPYPVSLTFGKPLNASAGAQEVRQAIQELSSDVAIARKERYPLLHTSLLHNLKNAPFTVAAVDSSGTRLRGITLLALIFAVSKRLGTTASGGHSEMLGILLPSSIGGVLANVGALFSGKIPVNLNFTSSKESIASACKQCEIKEIISSRAFLEKLEDVALPENLKITYLEDIRAGISKTEILLRSITSILIPQRILEWKYLRKGSGRGDLATVIFSSGSTGDPKGVMLSHGNIQSNIEALYTLFSLGKKDAVLGVLPFFHSFGFTGTLWFPLLAGFRAVYHPSPLDAQLIGELVEKEKVSILMSTPTFLMGYLRRCTKEQFATLKYAVVGAEKLKVKLAESFQEKFGIAPLEGYGCTELSPVAIINVPDVSDGVVEQRGQKGGTVGHPIPGVAVRVVDPDTRESLALGSEGLLLIRGPNVMMGYLGDTKKTEEVIRDGWYVTGDIAKLDDDGFVTITDRLSRFSKIGGEMIPHVRIEEAIHHVAGTVEQICCVTAVPDEKKGEKLVVLHSIDFDVIQIVAKLSENGLPNLWIPKKENFFKVDSLPLLGTGKLDLKMIKVKASELTDVKMAIQ